MIKPYLRDMIDDYKTRKEWKIKLTMEINFISSKDSEETSTMYTKSHNIEMIQLMKQMILLKTFGRKNERKLDSFDSIDLFYYHLQKIDLKRDRSYIDSPEWLKNEKATINSKTNDDNCFPLQILH